MCSFSNCCVVCPLVSAVADPGLGPVPTLKHSSYIQCAVCSVQCAVCSVQCAVCSVPCAVCRVQCSVCYLLAKLPARAVNPNLDDEGEVSGIVPHTHRICGHQSSAAPAMQLSIKLIDLYHPITHIAFFFQLEQQVVIVSAPSKKL